MNCFAGDLLQQIHHQLRVLGFVRELFGELGVGMALDALADFGIKRRQRIENRLDRRVFFESLRFQPAHMIGRLARLLEKRRDHGALAIGVGAGKRSEFFCVGIHRTICLHEGHEEKIVLAQRRKGRKVRKTPFLCALCVSARGIPNHFGGAGITVPHFLHVRSFSSLENI